MIQESRSDDDTTLSGSTGGEDVPQSIASLIRSSLLLSSSSSSSSYGSSFTSSFTSPLFDVTQDDGNDDDQLLVSEQGSSFNDTLFASASSLPSSSLSPSFVTKSFLAENDSSLSTNFSKVSSERSSLDSSSSSAFTLSEYFTSLTAPQTLSYASSSMSLPLQSILTPTNQTFLAESNSSLYSLYHEDNPFEDPITNLDSRINDGSLLPFANNSTGVVDFKIHHPILAIILGIMCLCVIFGNVLVMIAIRRERYLQTVTNYFVASLAAADCLVGLVVMPFSVVHEVMNKSWIFGQDWCDLWHSLDVLASTASILNLCVISMDRYWAITDPLSYPCKLTSKRAKVLIAVVWTCSSLISFPAIIWWRATSEADPPEYSCLFTEDIGYLVFSSIISFYGPLTVMIYVYYRIYRAATEQTRAIKLGSKNVCMVSRGKTKEEPISSLNSPGNKGNTGGYCEENGPVVLRIHRGGFTSLNQANQIMESQMNGLAGHHPAVSSRETIPSSSGKSLNRFSSFFKKKTNNKDRRHDKAKVMSRDVNDHKDDIDDKDNSLKLAASRTPSNPAEDIPGSSSSPNNNITSRMNDASTKSSMDTARAAKNLKAWSMGKRFSKLAKEKKAAKTLGKHSIDFYTCIPSRTTVLRRFSQQKRFQSISVTLLFSKEEMLSIIWQKFPLSYGICRHLSKLCTCSHRNRNGSFHPVLVTLFRD